jgi:hypothetical protein
MVEQVMRAIWRLKEMAIHKKERASRRLAGEPPQFGMFAEQSVAPPLHPPPLRSVSGEGHLNGKFPPPKEASTRNRLLIYTDTPIQINSETLVTPVITEDILSYTMYDYCVISWCSSEDIYSSDSSLRATEWEFHAIKQL